MFSDEKLLALSKDRLEILRQNALKRRETVLVQRIEAIQNALKPQKNNSPADPVVGFHFVCQADYEVTPVGQNQFWSGVWVVSDALCAPAVRLGGYLALHTSKNEKSYRQGRLLDWKLEPRSKGVTRMGVSFLVQSSNQPQRWYGAGAGEKGYRRTTDQPHWA